MKNHVVTFYTLKKKCATAPVLLEMDASKYGLGAILQQMQEDGKYHPVMYSSHALCGSEANYHSSKLEFLALKWAITKQFKEYLMYQPFTMCTDNNALTYILTMPNLDATGPFSLLHTSVGKGEVMRRPLSQGRILRRVPGPV